MLEIRAITLDLDDTLWPIEPVINIAEERLFNWMSEYCPRVTQNHSLESLMQLRAQLTEQRPDLAHDLTEQRKLFLAQLIVERHGYHPHYADLAMEKFLTHRNEVEFFPDALPFLEIASKNFPIISISNGNADLSRIGINRLFCDHVSSREVGVAKPDTRIFFEACQRLAYKPSEVLHIGDHPTQDILGAAKAGMKTAWVNRTGIIWENEQHADIEVSSLEEILELLPL